MHASCSCALFVLTGRPAMKLRILGCAGGIGGQERLTTSLLVDDDILLDAGTGLTSLSIADLLRIDHVFISHAHLDHVVGLAFLLDAVQGRRERPVIVHATDKVISALKKHLFNWVLWPDFAMIPSVEKAILRWDPIAPDARLEIAGRRLHAYPVNHTVGSTAYLVRNARAGFLFTGDMSDTPALWQALRTEDGVEKVIVDCSFTDSDAEIAEKSMHYCPRTLLADIAGVPTAIEFLIYHLKPAYEVRIMDELRSNGAGRHFTALRCEDVFEF